MLHSPDGQRRWSAGLRAETREMVLILATAKLRL